MGLIFFVNFVETMSGKPQDVVWEHGDNLYPRFRCKYCNTVKAGGGATRFKQHLAARRLSVVHCRSVPLQVQ
jgi:hypothetical protein